MLHSLELGLVVLDLLVGRLDLLVHGLDGLFSGLELGFYVGEFFFDG